jgi:hypothetical protein
MCRYCLAAEADVQPWPVTVTLASPQVSKKWKSKQGTK